MMNHVENHFVFLDNDRGEIDGPALQGLDRGKEHLSYFILTYSILKFPGERIWYLHEYWSERHINNQKEYNGRQQLELSG